jgi:AcrR family transcriptional regulator
MPIGDRRARELAARRRLIITTARKLAEANGWDCVTTRRLSTEIEYSQPVLYAHFDGMDHIIEAVAIDGFGELTDALQTARFNAATGIDALRRIAHAYVEFARENRALYDAMFTRTTTLHFAAEDTPPELQTAFAELRDVVSTIDNRKDPDTLTEVFWAALHGLITLTANHRLRPGHDLARVDLLVDILAFGHEAPTRQM